MPPFNEGEMEPEDSDWIVSLESLRIALTKHIELANRDEEGAQESIAQNIDGDCVLLRLEGPPDVTVRLEIDPDAAAAVAKVSMVDIDGQSLRDLIPFVPNPFEMKLPAGLLHIRAIVEPEDPTLHPRLRKTFVIRPPVAPCPLRLSRT